MLANLVSVVVLGGRLDRVKKFARWMAMEGPYLKPTVWFGTEGPPAAVHELMAAEGVTRDKYMLDYRAWDTLSTFIELYKDIVESDPLVLYVATDQYHLRRSLWVAKAVFLFSGITVVPMELHTDEPGEEESVFKALRDAAMGLVFAVTGMNLASRSLKRKRWAMIAQWAEEAKANAGTSLVG
jgi:uncharacterized SAM-binding protein YcdF (DUF218 family)